MANEIKKEFEEWIKENGGTDGVLYQTFSDEELEHIFRSAYVKGSKRQRIKSLPKKNRF